MASKRFLGLWVLAAPVVLLSIYQVDLTPAHAQDVMEAYTGNSPAQTELLKELEAFEQRLAEGTPNAKPDRVKELEGQLAECQEQLKVARSKIEED